MNNVSVTAAIFITLETVINYTILKRVKPFVS